MYEKRGYLLSDFRLFHLNDAQGTNVEYHYHEFYKLLFLCSGTGNYNVEGEQYRLRAGDIVLIGSRQVHRPEFEKGMPYERIILYISPEFLKNNSAAGCNLEEMFTGMSGQEKAQAQARQVLRLGEKERSRLFFLVEKLEKELSEETFGKEIACRGLLLRLLVEIGRRCTEEAGRQGEAAIRAKEAKESKREGTAEKAKKARIREMLCYLDAHPEEEISMDALSERFFVSKYHMMRQFKEETGQSVYDYLTERRLLYARNLIRQGKSATESCFGAGFKSYSSFTRAYAKRFGTTPTGRAGRNMKREETYE